MKTYKITFGEGDTAVTINEPGCTDYSQAVARLERSGIRADFSLVTKVEVEIPFTVFSIHFMLSMGGYHVYGSTSFWEDKDYNAVIEKAITAGYVTRSSFTQAHWTEEGLTQAKKDLPAGDMDLLFGILLFPWERKAFDEKFIHGMEDWRPDWKKETLTRWIENFRHESANDGDFPKHLQLGFF